MAIKNQGLVFLPASAPPVLFSLAAMQPEVFLPVLLESGLDIFSLRLRFHMRSYASVAIRVRELLKPPAVDDGSTS